MKDLNNLYALVPAFAAGSAAGTGYIVPKEVEFELDDYVSVI